MASSLADRWTFLDTIIQKLRFRKIAGRIPEGCVLADLGCGDGDFLRYIEHKVAAGYGVDTRIGNAHGSERLIFRCGDLNRHVPLKDGSVDVVTALAVVEHLAAPEIFIRELRRIVKPGGCCILTTPSPRAKPLLEFLAYKMKIISERDIRDHKHYFSRAHLQDFFAAFSSVQISYFQFGLNTLIIVVK